MNAEKTLENLSRNGFDAKYFGTAAQAADYLAAQLHGKTIGFGGSVTLDTMGLYDRLSADNTLFWHWKQPADEARAAAAHAQIYLTSANAIAETGEIVNIDGSGNRLASMLYGHEALYIVAGVNKLTPNLHAAIARAKNVASPLNARRFGKQTPCVLTEPMRCHDCDCPDRICRTMELDPKYATVIVQHPKSHHPLRRRSEAHRTLPQDSYA